MIKQIPSNEVEAYIKNNPQSILLDVRTEEEWSTDGKPDGEKFGLKTYFLTIKDENFINDFEKLGIQQDQSSHDELAQHEGLLLSFHLGHS